MGQSVQGARQATTKHLSLYIHIELSLYLISALFIFLPVCGLIQYNDNDNRNTSHVVFLLCCFCTVDPTMDVSVHIHRLYIHLFIILFRIIIEYYFFISLYWRLMLQNYLFIVDNRKNVRMCLMLAVIIFHSLCINDH